MQIFEHKTTIRKKTQIMQFVLWKLLVQNRAPLLVELVVVGVYVVLIENHVRELTAVIHALESFLLDYNWMVPIKISMLE